MRLSVALLSSILAVAGCGARDQSPPRSGGPAPVVKDLPPVAVPFRWSVEPIGCTPSFELRSTGDRCTSAALGEVAVRVMAEPTPALEVQRTGAVAWRASLPMPAAVSAPVIVNVDDASAVVVAAARADAIEVVVLELATGAVRTHGVVPVAGVTALQLERPSDGGQLRIHGRTPAGGVTALLDVVTGSLLGLAQTPAAAIRTRMEQGAVAADGVIEGRAGAEPLWAGWDGDELVVRVGDTTTPRWRTMLTRSGGPFRSEHVTALVGGDLIVGTIHHPSATSTQVFALGLADGAVRWRLGVTGLGPIAHSGYRNQVAARVAGDYLVVQGVESGGTYVCTVELATGRERACVDHLAESDVAVPAEPSHLTPPRPARQRPLGPQVSSVLCRPSPKGVPTFSSRRESAVNLTATIATHSLTCKPTLSGGIVGDRIELTVHDRGPAADAPCECRIFFRQDYAADSKAVIVFDDDGDQLVRADVPGWQ